MRAKLKWMFLAAGSVYLASPAGAQPKAAPVTNTLAPAADGQVDVSKKAQLSPTEQLAESDVAVAKMERAAAAVRKQLETARKEKDVVKTLCLDDKLSQVDVVIRTARERKQSLQGAVTSNDPERASHEFTILQVLRQRAEQLTAEANQCIGEEASYLGQTKVTTTVDPGVSQTEEAPYPPSEINFVGNYVDPPQCISCSK
jgi:hypothetical protein